MSEVGDSVFSIQKFSKYRKIWSSHTEIQIFPFSKSFLTEKYSDQVMQAKIVFLKLGPKRSRTSGLDEKFCKND